MKPKSTTDLYCIIGHPVDHSLSPDMHNTAFEHQGLDNVYLAFDSDVKDLKDTINALKRLGVKGFNVTTPLKEPILKYCDSISDLSKITGAVNTVKIEDGKLYGTTTDGIGFFDGLKESGVDVKGKKIILLGAGGAAKVIAAESLNREIEELVIANRTLKRAEDLIDSLKEVAEKRNIKLKAIPLLDSETLSDEIGDSDILINATSVGLESKGMIVPEEALHQNLTVCDIVYRNETELLKVAREKGLKVVDGLPMLLNQGAASYKIWTGQDFPTEIVKETVFSD